MSGKHLQKHYLQSLTIFKRFHTFNSSSTATPASSHTKTSPSLKEFRTSAKASKRACIKLNAAPRSINRCTSSNQWQGKARWIRLRALMEKVEWEREKSVGRSPRARGREKEGDVRARAFSVSVNASPPEWPINSNYGKEATITRLRGSILNPRARALYSQARLSSSSLLSLFISFWP